nr:RNA-directed DNA polymerase, eukaryota, reverse transcriptase zinc-binding domain protein [Tanacetum cinerariifolium]
MDSENDYDKVNMPLFPSPEPTVSYFDDLNFLKDFEKEFLPIVYNDALTSKSDILTEPTINPQHIDELNLKYETSLSECDEEEQNVLYFNYLFPSNVIYSDDSKSNKDNDDKIDIKHSSGDLSIEPLPNSLKKDGYNTAYWAILMDTAYGERWIRRIGKCEYTFSCEDLALIRRISFSGFGFKWRSWIKACWESSRASVFINGSPTSEFSPKRGLRHGDPLSYFVFILIMEGLHVALSNVITSGLIPGVKFGFLEMNLSHLFYVVDVVITTEWSTDDMDNIIRVLQVFYLASGLKINIHKSNMHGIGVSTEEVYDMASNRGGFDQLGCKANGIWAKIVDSSNYLYLDGILPTFPFGARQRLLDHRSYLLWSMALDFSRADVGVRNLAYLRDTLNEISQIDIISDKDACVSSLANDGVFSVGATRMHIDNLILPSLDPTTTWDKTAPRKVNIYMRRLKLD